MFRPLALVAMRQQTDKARHAQPFAFARRQELIEDHLRAIGEIAELRLPEHESLRFGERIAIFETEHRLFRKHRIDDLELAFCAAQMFKRNVTALILLIDQHCMALREGAALAVLTGEADAMALAQQRAEGERFGGGPVYADAGVDRRASRVEKAPDRAMNVEAFRRRGQFLADLAQRLQRSAGFAAAFVVRGLIARLQPRPMAIEPVGLVGLEGQRGVEFLRELFAPLAFYGVDRDPRHMAFGHELFPV